jgi:hypothetical protein
VKRFLVLGVVGALLLSGCGGSGGEETSGQAAAQARVEAREAKRQAAQRRVEARQRAKAHARREAARRARQKAQRERQAEARQARAEQAEAVEAEEAVAAEEAAAEEEEEASECDPNYSGACLDPYASDYDCSDGEGDGPEYTGTVTVVGEDHYGLDSDSDGTGCEID